MNKNLYFISLLLISFLTSCKNNQANDDSSRPNIIYILADDLGFGELGVYGQEIIETPNIDALAKEGMRFSQHYTAAPVCAPARCMLLTGQHAGHAYVRGNDEWGERGKVWDYQAMYDNSFLEGQRPLPDSIITIAEMLQQAGYKTGMVGKWGLGAPTTEGVPNKQGFDFFYGYNCQRQAHTYYPMHLWRNEKKDLLNNRFVKLHANFPKGADPDEAISYSDFNLKDYAPELMHNEALAFMEANKKQPFFLYYASPIPHVPLQAPKKWLDYYRKKLGKEKPYLGNSYYPNQTPRAAYAAMISYLDEQVGDLVAKLKEMGVYEKTLIIFTSDNGPTYTGGADTPFFDSAKPFKTEYGWGKGFTHEGGIRVPMIASWKGKIKPNSNSDHISAFYDVMATLCEVSNIVTPKQTDGISFLPTLLGQKQKAHEYLYWEFPSYSGQQAIRMGKWKGIRKNIFSGNMGIELYNLEEDLQEQNNVADKYPELVEQIKNIMFAEHRPAELDRFKMETLGDVKQSYLDAVGRAKNLATANALTIKLSEGYFTLSKRTKVKGINEATKALSILLEKLEKTGGYLLDAIDQEKKNLLVFQNNKTIKKGKAHLSISKENILIEANDENGFVTGIETLLKLMDQKIWQQKEMHNPKWVIAALEINN